MMDCSEVRLSLGVYVLGAIDPAERALVDSHLAYCRDCRDELAGLAGLPELLARVSTAEAVALAASDPRPAWEEEGLEPPDRLVSTVVDLTAARRRRRRWRESVLGVAAALVIAVGIFGGLRLTATPSGNSAYNHGPSGPWQSASGRSDGMAAWVDYRTMTWGTQLEAKVSGVPGGITCQIWVVGSGKTLILAGSWTVHNNEGDIWYPASAAIPAGNVQKFVITVGKSGSITADS
jgi:hypothetical protein